MGLIKEAIYYYRRRSDFSSAIQTKKNHTEYYFGTINYVYNYFINKSKKLYNKILPFIQFLLSYEILFRFEEPAYNYLNQSNFNKYIVMIEQILKEIEDKYILEQNILPNRYKLFVLSKKYNKDLRYEIRFENNCFVYSKYVMINMNNQNNIIILRNLYINNNILFIEAIDNLWIPRDNFFYFCKIGNETFLPKYYENQFYDFITLYGIIEKGRIISFEIPLTKQILSKIIFFYIVFLDIFIEIFPLFGEFSHIPNINNGFYRVDNYLIQTIRKRLIIYKYNKKQEILFENQYFYELKNAKKYDIIKLRKYIKYRNKIKKNLEYKIWLITDSHDKAGDTGEYFFRYLKMKNIIGIKPYFVIKKNCSDYKRLNIIGNVLDLNSNTFKIYFLQSDKIFSSVFNNLNYNPFKKESPYIRDLFHFDFIFLPNLISNEDNLKLLRCLDRIFNTSINLSKNIYNSMLNFENELNRNNEIFSCFQRSDKPQCHSDIIKKDKSIIIAPVFITLFKNKINFSNSFKNNSKILELQKFYDYYNYLINNEKLISIMKHYNYTGIFCLHNTFKSIWKKFKPNNQFSIIENCDYHNILLKGTLLITDYSNIFYYFIFLKKPVIFSFFNYDEYMKNNAYKAYFNYKIKEFGPFCKDIKCTINEIIYEIKNNFILRNTFFKEINNFLNFPEDNNTDNILKSIIIMNNRNFKFNKKLDIIFFGSILFLIIYKFIIYFTKNEPNIIKDKSAYYIISNIKH